MRSSFLPLTLLATALCMSMSVAVSQTLEKREPGLWEVRLHQDSQLGALMQGMQGIQGMLDDMPAAQRESIEKALQGSGLSMSEPNLIKQCVTAEMAAREFEPPVDDPDMQCQHVLNTISSSEATFTFSCQSPDGAWKGEGRVWDLSPKRYSSEMTLAGSVDGQPMEMDMKHEARWLGSDCQGIKPAM